MFVIAEKVFSYWYLLFLIPVQLFAILPFQDDWLVIMGYIATGFPFIRIL